MSVMGRCLNRVATHEKKKKRVSGTHETSVKLDQRWPPGSWIKLHLDSVWDE